MRRSLPLQQVFADVLRHQTQVGVGLGLAGLARPVPPDRPARMRS